MGLVAGKSGGFVGSEGLNLFNTLDFGVLSDFHGYDSVEITSVLSFCVSFLFAKLYCNRVGQSADIKKYFSG